MNRLEFFSKLQDFENSHKNTLKHSNGRDFGYYAKIDKYYPDGTSRYFYTKEQWDAYQKGLELSNKAKQHNDELAKKEKIEKQQKETFEKNKAASQHEGDKYQSRWERGILPSGTQRSITKPEQVYSTFMDSCNFVNYLKGHSSTGHINDSLYYGYDNEGMKEDRKAIEKAMKFMNTEEEKFKTRLKNDPNLNERDKEQILREYEEVYKQNLLRFDEITKDEESFNKHRAKIIKERGEQTLYDKSKPFLDAIPAKYGEKVSELGNEIINGHYDNFIDYAVEDMKKEGFDDFYIKQVIPIFKKSLSKKVYIYLRRIGKDIHNDEWDWIFDDK